MAEEKKKAYDKRKRTAVFFDDEQTAYLAHLPVELKALMTAKKEITGKSYNLQIIEALESYFEHPEASQ